MQKSNSEKIKRKRKSNSKKHGKKEQKIEDNKVNNIKMINPFEQYNSKQHKEIIDYEG